MIKKFTNDDIVFIDVYENLGFGQSAIWTFSDYENVVSKTLFDCSGFKFLPCKNFLKNYFK